MNIFEKDVCKNCESLCEFVKFIDEETKTENLKHLIKVRYKKKETILKQNNHSTHLIFLKSGLAKIFTERRNDKNIILKIVVPNEIIGITHLSSDIYNFTAVALKDSEVCLLPKEYFINLMVKNKNFIKYMLDEQSKYTAFLVDKLSSLGTKQMHGRLADVILYLCGSDFRTTDVFDYITRRDIAEMSGMSSESAIRLLTEFKNDGLIKTNGKRIEINNVELLSRLSEIG
jgi:CRP/FNR family transcriptional regulator, polysaccharide utilization system transcription regulator